MPAYRTHNYGYITGEIEEKFIPSAEDELALSNHWTYTKIRNDQEQNLRLLAKEKEDSFFWDLSNREDGTYTLVKDSFYSASLNWTSQDYSERISFSFDMPSEGLDMFVFCDQILKYELMNFEFLIDCLESDGEVEAAEYCRNKNNSF